MQNFTSGSEVIPGTKTFYIWVSIMTYSIKRIKFSNDSQPPNTICKEFYKVPQGMLALSGLKHMLIGCVFNVIIWMSMVGDNEFNEILGIHDLHKLPIQLLYNHLQLFSPVSYHFM